MKLLRRLHTLLRRRKLDADMAEEMRAHLEMQAEQAMARGRSPEEAHYEARRAFGGVEQVKERCREQRFGQWLETVWRDLRYGYRSLRRQPGFTIIAVLTLGFGIGVNTTIFSVIEDLISRPAARDREQNLVVVHLARRGGDQGYRAFSYAEFEAVRANPMFSRAAALEFTGARIGSRDEMQKKLLCFVSDDYFPALGVTPLQGRFFSAAETRPNAELPVVVASYLLWQRLGGRRDFVGSQIAIDGQPCTVIGVTPREFGGLQWSIGPEVWAPLGLAGTLGSGRVNLSDSKQRPLVIVANLQPELSLEAANAAIAGLDETINRLAGTSDHDRVKLIVRRPSPGNLDLTAPGDDSAVVRYGALAVAMTVAVLLVACLNVANMLLARGTTRHKEIALRLSLGASRGRVIRQLLTEGLLLGCVGGGVGLLLSRLVNQVLLDFTRQIMSHQPFSFHLQTRVDPPLLLATFGLCLVATLACSVGPALRATRLNLVEDLKLLPGDSAGADRSSRFFSGRHVLIMLQIALSVILLFSAGVFVRSANRVEQDRGFESAGQLVVKTDYAVLHTPTKEMPRLQVALLDRAAAIPGIERAALASSVPYNFESSWWKVFASGSDAPASNQPVALHAIHTAVSDGYFATLGIPLLRGRDFTRSETQRDDGPPVVIVDERLALALFKEASPLGRHLFLNTAHMNDGNPRHALEIVGVVRSPGDDPLASERPMRIYRPFGQSRHSTVYVHAKTAQPEAVLPALRQALGPVDAELPVVFCGLFSEIVDRHLNLWSVRMAAIMFAVFGGAAVFLAAVGVYGVKAYAVMRRTREIGVRIALGAERRDVLSLVLKQAAQQTFVGIAVGSILAVFAGLGLSELLYRVAPADPLMLSFAIGVASSAALVAAAVPAWRATRISPSVALRTE